MSTPQAQVNPRRRQVGRGFQGVLGPPAAPSADGRPGFRPDVEGLRAVAVLLVMLGHAGVPFLPGGYIGVDVFFVISGFLITGRIHREIEATGKLSLARFYAARVERLLPAATVALYFVLVVMLLFLPKIRWRDTAFDIAASAAYFVNWRLEDRSVDYFATNLAPSAVQHFWSLSVEEQFYLFWPVLLVVAVGIMRLCGVSIRRSVRPLLILLGVVAFGSMVWAVALAYGESNLAYFHTGARLWELALGAGLAFAVRLRPRWYEAIPVAAAGWVGLGLIAASAVVFGANAGFPGPAALVPTIGTGIILLAGAVRPPTGQAFGLLSRASMQAIGALSYSLYLWHWPLLVVFAAQFGPLPAWAGLLVVALSAVPAYLCYRFVESPIRRRGWLRRSPANAMVVTMACAFLAAGPAVLVGVTTDTTVDRAHVAALDQIQNGATVLSADPRGDQRGAPVDQVANIVPDPEKAGGDLPDVDRDGCFTPQEESTPRVCDYGNRSSTHTIVLVGDSHAVQWVPGLRAVVEAKGWHLKVYGKGACPFVKEQVALQPSGRRYTTCSAWNSTVRSAILAERPQLVITTSFRFGLMGPDGQLIGEANSAARVEALRESWSELSSAGIPVVVLRDTPHAPFNVAECVSERRDKLTECAFPRQAAIDGIGIDQEAAAAGLAGVSVINLNDAICPTDPCAPVIGEVLIYRDGDHLTATYVLSLAPRLLTALEPLVGRT